MSLDIKTRTEQHAAIVSIAGEVDMYSSTQARAAILEQIGKKVRQIVVDLDQVPYMDSSGVAVLIEGLKKCGEYGGTLSITGLRDNVREVFELTRLDKIFKIYENLEAALAE